MTTRLSNATLDSMPGSNEGSSKEKSGAALLAPDEDALLCCSRCGHCEALALWEVQNFENDNIGAGSGTLRACDAHLVQVIRESHWTRTSGRVQVWHDDLAHSRLLDPAWQDLCPVEGCILHVWTAAQASGSEGTGHE